MNYNKKNNDMKKEAWLTKAKQVIKEEGKHTAIKARALNAICPFQFNAPPVSTGNWDDISWLKYLIVFAETN